jgi:hypothetical protein
MLEGLELQVVAASSSTTASGNDTSNSSVASPPVIVGGVVGSVAGVAILVFCFNGLHPLEEEGTSRCCCWTTGMEVMTQKRLELDLLRSLPGGMTERRSLAYRCACCTGQYDWLQEVIPEDGNGSNDFIDCWE